MKVLSQTIIPRPRNSWWRPISHITVMPGTWSCHHLSQLFSLLYWLDVKSKGGCVFLSVAPTVFPSILNLLIVLSKSILYSISLRLYCVLVFCCEKNCESVILLIIIVLCSFCFLSFLSGCRGSGQSTVDTWLITCSKFQFPEHGCVILFLQSGLDPMTLTLVLSRLINVISGLFNCSKRWSFYFMFIIEVIVDGGGVLSVLSGVLLSNPLTSIEGDKYYIFNYIALWYTSTTHCSLMCMCFATKHCRLSICNINMWRPHSSSQTINRATITCITYSK